MAARPQGVLPLETIRMDLAHSSKIQLPASQTTMHILMYDQARRVQITVAVNECPGDALKKLREACAIYGYLGLKVYAWARLAADNEISIAIDRLPDQKSISW